MSSPCKKAKCLYKGIGILFVKEKRKRLKNEKAF